MIKPRFSIGGTQNYLVIIIFFIMQFEIQKNATYPDDGYPDRLGPSSQFVVNSTKLYKI